MTAGTASPIIKGRLMLSLPMPELNPLNLPPPAESPEPGDVRQLRERLQLVTGHNITNAQRLCASLVETTPRRWQEWEAGKYGMHPGLYKLAVMLLSELKPARKKPGL